MSVLYIQSSDSTSLFPFAFAQASAAMRVVRDEDLAPADFFDLSGLITTIHIDQIGFLRYAAVLRQFLDRGGRWIFNGHMQRPFLPGQGVYVPLSHPERADCTLVRLAEHPIFDQVPQEALQTNKGVAGFYGRGYNPLPPGAIAINGLGPAHLPIDWVWPWPGGGALFSHAGNDFWGCGDDPALKHRLAEQAFAWVSGGGCA